MLCVSRRGTRVGRTTHGTTTTKEGTENRKKRITNREWEIDYRFRCRWPWRPRRSQQSRPHHSHTLTRDVCAFHYGQRFLRRLHDYGPWLAAAGAVAVLAAVAGPFLHQYFAKVPPRRRTAPIPPGDTRVAQRRRRRDSRNRAEHDGFWILPGETSQTRLFTIHFTFVFPQDFFAYLWQLSLGFFVCYVFRRRFFSCFSTAVYFEPLSHAYCERGKRNPENSAVLPDLTFIPSNIFDTFH